MGESTSFIRRDADHLPCQGRIWLTWKLRSYPLYLKLGFREVERDTFSLKEWGGREEDLGGHVCMLRKPQSTKE